MSITTNLEQSIFRVKLCIPKLDLRQLCICFIVYIRPTHSSPRPLQPKREALPVPTSFKLPVPMGINTLAGSSLDRSPKFCPEQHSSRSCSYNRKNWFCIVLAILTASFLEMKKSPAQWALLNFSIIDLYSPPESPMTELRAVKN